MTTEDIREFLESSKNVMFFPQRDAFDSNDILIHYTTDQNIEWVTFSLFFQENYSKTVNIVDITEKENGKIDFLFQANSETKAVEILATDLNYDKNNFDLFAAKFKDGFNFNMRFVCYKESSEMEQTQTIDPSDDANQPIQIVRINLRPLGTSSGDLTIAS